jgi:nitroreductase
MSKTAITAAPILPVLAERWSPRSFNETYLLTKDETVSVLEAARWATTSNNSTPARFSVLVRGTELHAAVAPALASWNAAWGPTASALIVVSVSKVNQDGSPAVFAQYDAGLQVGNLVVQAQGLGLVTHQMAGLDKAAAAAALDLHEDMEIITVIAIGKIDAADKLQGPLHEREIAPRTRADLADIVLHGLPA